MTSNKLRVLENALKKPKIIIGKEYAVHKQIADYLAVALVGFFNTIENSNRQGGAAGRAKQVILKSLGAKTGIPDIIIHYYREKEVHLLSGESVKINIPASMYLEVKRQGATARQSQIDLHIELAKWGIPAEVVHDVDEVRAAFKKHNVPTRESVWP